MKQIALVLFAGILTGACFDGSEPRPSRRRGSGTPAVAAAAPPPAAAAVSTSAPRVGSAEWHKRRAERAEARLRRAERAGEERPSPPPDKGAWRTGSAEDAVTGRTRHVAVLNASNETKGHVFQTTPTLNVRCQDNKTEVYIDWENYLDGNSGDFRDNRHVVTVRIGDGDPFTVRATVSTNNESTFFPSPIPSILKPAANADTLAARTTPYNESPQTAVFNLTGMRAALSDLAAACNWSF